MPLPGHAEQQDLAALGSFQHRSHSLNTAGPMLNWDTSKSTPKLDGSQSHQCDCTDTPARGKVQGNGPTSKLLKHTLFAPFFPSSPLCLYLAFGWIWEMLNSRANISFVILLTLL